MLYELHQKASLDGHAVILYNTASELCGHHLNFSEMSGKGSPQFPSKFLGLPDREIKKSSWEMVILSQVISASNEITTFLIRFKFCHAVMLVQAPLSSWTGSLLTCPDHKGLQVCSAGRESPAQGLVCTTPMLLLHVSIWEYIYLYRDLDLQAEAQLLKPMQMWQVVKHLDSVHTSSSV